MKKYISPIARVVELNTEEVLLAGSPTDVYNQGGGVEASNRRSASESIWGSDEEE